jgi:glycosyltransferase involved in cell wall biosynthesis
MKLSIITINFNHLEGLKRTYDSVIGQSFRDFEWIVIDGGSTDGSREFIEEHQASFAYWCSEPDKGVYNAMNKGIGHARGEYLNFMNSGDTYFDGESLSKVFSRERNADVVYGAMLLSDGTLDHGKMMKSKIHWFDLYNDTIPHQASFICRKLFDEIGLYDESYRISADWYFFAKAFVLHGATFDFVPAVLARFEGGGISTDNALAEAENLRFHQKVFGMFFLPMHDRMMYFDVIHQYRLLAVIYTLLYKTALVCDRIFNRKSVIEGYRKI